MYRNCVYNNQTKSIHLWTWDASGNRVKQELDFRPYLYLEHRTGDERSIFGTPIKKKEFNTKWDRDKFIKDSGIKRIFENLPPYQQFLIDNYYLQCENDDFAQFPLKVMFLDIECPGPVGGKFPEPALAENVIDLLTCYDSETKRYTVFGLKAYKPDSDNVDYYHCKSEHDLLKKFIGHFSSDYPDCLVGYNSANFDIPYLINRITFELGKEWADELSPIGRIYEKINSDGKFGMPTTEYVIEGISCVDYYVLYRKYSLTQLEYYKLDYVAEEELGEHKVEYEGSIAELALRDWDTYVKYNIKDVELLVKLDDKLRYLELLRFTSYLGLCNMENAVRTVPVINGAVAIRARIRGEKIPTFIRPKAEGKIPGAYVAFPTVGFSQNLVSFDANSLYPSVMISLNMSPETKVGSVEKIDDKYIIKHVSGRTYELSLDNYKKFIVEDNLAKSESGILFSQKKKGLMPEFLEFLYDKRKEMKSKASELKKKMHDEAAFLSEEDKKKREVDIQKFDTFQHAYKITLNSTYGYCANKHAPLGDDEIGTSVTLTGQSVIKKSNELFLDFIQENYPQISRETAELSLIYNDTDSCYISLRILENCGIPLLENGSVSPAFFKVCEQIEKYINNGCNEWAKRKLWSKDPRFVFKREAICDSAIFLGKKYYVLHMLDDEGTPVDKYKYKGVDVVKTTMPKALKPYVKDIIKTMITTRSYKETNDKFLEAYEVFKGLDANSIYNNSGINNYEEYAKKCNEFVVAPRTPGHVKAAYYHDLLVDKLGLPYPKFKSGDKVRRVYVKTPNKYGIDIIGFKGNYPKEFLEIFEVDYERMFGKILYAAIERFFNAANWKLRKPNENLRIELEDLFGE